MGYLNRRGKEGGGVISLGSLILESWTIREGNCVYPNQRRWRVKLERKEGILRPRKSGTATKKGAAIAISPSGKKK